MINLYFLENGKGLATPTKLVLADGTTHLYNGDEGRLDFSVLAPFKGQDVTIHTTREVTESDVWVIDDVVPEDKDSGSKYTLYASNKAALEKKKQREEFMKRLEEERAKGSEIPEQDNVNDMVEVRMEMPLEEKREA